MKFVHGLQNAATTEPPTIVLMSHIGKLMMTILSRRLRGQAEHSADEQAGFLEKNRSTIYQILALRLIAEIARRKGRAIFNCFVDLQKAFDSNP